MRTTVKHSIKAGFIGGALLLITACTPEQINMATQTIGVIANPNATAGASASTPVHRYKRPSVVSILDW